MAAALSVAGRVTPLHGASEAALGQLEQPACGAERAEDELGAVAGSATGLEQALQDKVQQQAAQLQQQAELLRDALNGLDNLNVTSKKINQAKRGPYPN